MKRLCSFSLNTSTLVKLPWKLVGVHWMGETLEVSSDNIVVVFPDHGSRYMSKIYSDQWMENQGFFDSQTELQATIEYVK